MYPTIEQIRHYLGGSGHDTITDLIIDNDGHLCLVGDTSSLDFPLINAFDTNEDLIEFKLNIPINPQ
jgi:hypothetical protein